MQLKITRKLLFLALILSSISANAQMWIGRTTGNYSGTYGLYNNASSISDSKYKYYFNFWGRGVNFYNNYLLYNSPIKLNQWANSTYDPQYRTLDDRVDYKKDWLLENLDGKNKYFSFNQDIFGPAFMFPVSKNWNMSINTRQRTGFQIFGINEDVARWAYTKPDSNKYASLNQGFGININSYQELSFTLGGILAKNEHNQLNGGATVKFLRGLGAAYLKGNSVNIRTVGTNGAQINGDIQYAYTDVNSVLDPINKPYGLFSLQSRGAGAGIDLGLNYTYTSRPLKHQSNKCNENDKRSDYDFKLALALNDVGGIKYGKNSSVYSYSSGVNTNLTAPNTILDPFHVRKENGFDTIGQTVFAGMGATKSYGFSTSLPTAINVQMDFRLHKNFYMGMFLNQNLKKANSTGFRSTSMLSIVPRIESRGFEFSMPLTLSENYRNFYLGMYTRIGPVFFGSDNLGGLLNVASNSQFSGADIYGGISFGIGHCLRWTQENKVDPVYMDSTRRDTIRKETTLRDTIVKKDTVTITKKDTVYLDKAGKDKVLTEKERLLKLREAELEKKRQELETREKALIANKDAAKKCNDENLGLKNKINDQNKELEAGRKRISELEAELAKCKRPQETVNNAEVVRKQKQIDSLTILLGACKSDYEKCRQDATKTSAEIVKKAELDKAKAENIARLANRKADSLQIVLSTKNSELDACRRNSNLSSAEIIRRAELDKQKAENTARFARKQADSMQLIVIQLRKELDDCKKLGVNNQAEVVRKLEANINRYKYSYDSMVLVLNQRNKELDNCRKLSVGTDAEVLKNLEKEKAKAESDAKIARKQADSLNIVLTQKNSELEACKKNSTQNNAEVVKKLENDKSKAENDAKIARKQADSLNTVLAQKNAELEACKNAGTGSQSETEAKLKKCQDENTLLKAEMGEMSKNIGKLNTRNTALSYRVDSLINELKNCCKNCSTGGSNEELEKCKAANNELNAEISTLKNRINAQSKSLDSMRNVSDNQIKKQAELNASIAQLNKTISDMKNAQSETNCDQLKQDLDSKTQQLNKYKEDNDILQNKLNTLDKQLNQYKTEYNFLLKQNQKCNSQLDSCRKGLYNTEPKGDGSGGQIENSDSRSGSTGQKNIERAENISKGIGLGLEILSGVLNSSGSSSKKSNGSGSNTNTSSGNNNQTSTAGTSSTGTSTTGRTTETGSGNSGSGRSNSRPTETTGTNTNNNSGNSTGNGSVGNTDRGSSGNSGSAVRR